MTRKRSFLFYSLLALLMAGCNKDFPFDFEPKNSEELRHINFTEPNLFPEAAVFDPIHNRFYVSSVTQGRIGIVTFDGTYKPFITDETLSETAGLEIDKARQRLLVCNGSFTGPNGVGAYNINSGARIFYTDLSSLLPGDPIFINDVALDPQGNAYVTNSFSPVIYKVDIEGKATIFFQISAFVTGPGEFGFNGIEYDERGFLLVAVTSRSQLVKVPVNNTGSYSIVQLDAPVSPDGLLLSKDGKQLVVVNNTGGTPEDKVLSFFSNDQWQSGSLSTSFSTGAVFPTTATSDGKRVFVLYSHIHKLLIGENQDIFTIQEVPMKKNESLLVQSYQGINRDLFTY